MVNRANILWIVLDTQRADALAPYRLGDPEPITPHLGAWAEKATVYERAIAPAQWTIPSHASMMTGEYPSTHQVLQADQALDPAYPTVAEVLRSRGYATVGHNQNIYHRLLPLPHPGWHLLPKLAGPIPEIPNGIASP